MMNLSSKYKLPLLLIFLASLVLLVIFSNISYETRVAKTSPFPVQCLEGWAHRGYVKAEEGYVENTLASYEKAIELGAAGIELDVIYDVTLNEFVVSHDEPYHVGKDGKWLLLKDAFARLPHVNIWLDAKNLSGLWPWQAEKATARLRELITDAGRKDQVLIESRNPWYLGDLAEVGFRTTLMISPNPKASGISMWTVILASKFSYSLSGFSGISMSYHRYHVEVSDSFSEAPVYLSTINSPPQVEKFKRLPQVKVFLTDNAALYGQHCL